MSWFTLIAVLVACLVILPGMLRHSGWRKAAFLLVLGGVALTWAAMRCGWGPWERHTARVTVDAVLAKRIARAESDRYHNLGDRIRRKVHRDLDRQFDRGITVIGQPEIPAPPEAPRAPETPTVDIQFDEMPELVSRLLALVGVQQPSAPAKQPPSPSPAAAKPSASPSQDAPATGRDETPALAAAPPSKKDELKPIEPPKPPESPAAPDDKPQVPKWVGSGTTWDRANTYVEVVGKLFATEKEADADAMNRAREAARERVAQLLGRSVGGWEVSEPDVRRLLVPDRYVEPVTSKILGDVMHRTHLRLNFTPKTENQLADRWRDTFVTGRVRQFGAGLGFLLLCLGTVCGYLKLDEATRGYYSGRLKLAGFAVIAVAVVALLKLIREGF